MLFGILFILDIKRIPLWYFIMFSVGYYFYTYQLSLKFNGTIVSILLIVFLLLCGFYDYGDSYAGSPDRIWLMMPLSLLASMVFIYLFMHLPDKINAYLAMFGRKTLGIYLCHFGLISIPIIAVLESYFTPLLQFIILVIIAIIIAFICIGIQMLVKCFPLLDLFLYGNKCENKK